MFFSVLQITRLCVYIILTVHYFVNFVKHYVIDIVYIATYKFFPVPRRRSGRLPLRLAILLQCT